MDLITKWQKRFSGRARRAFYAAGRVCGVAFHNHRNTWALLGKTTMMVVITQRQHADQKDRTLVFGVSGCLDAAGRPAFSKPRLCHELTLRPRPNASGRVLDPRIRPVKERRRGRAKAHGDWLDLALTVDGLRDQAGRAGWRLRTAPKLPYLWAAFTERQPLAMSQALFAPMARKTQQSLLQVATMDDQTRETLAGLVWDELWRAPKQQGNPTAYWVIPAQYVADLRTADAVFEDYTKILGAEVDNPFVSLRRLEFDNPVRSIAELLEIDLDQLRGVLHSVPNEADCRIAVPDIPYVSAYTMPDVATLPTIATSFRGRYEQALNDSLTLLAELRTHISLPDTTLYHAVMNPDYRIRVTDAAERRQLLQTMPAENLRQLIADYAPIVAAYASDAELCEAARELPDMMTLSRLPSLQPLAYDPDGRRDQLTFTGLPQGVSACLCAGGYATV